jgi:hypothetical protein
MIEYSWLNPFNIQGRVYLIKGSSDQIKTDTSVFSHVVLGEERRKIDIPHSLHAEMFDFIHG